MSDAEDEVLRLRGAIREAMAYADRDDESELSAKIWFTLHEALKTYEKPQRSGSQVDIKSLVDELDKDALWGLISAQSAQQREMESWQESVNVTRRKDRVLAKTALQEVADEIERELICCDVYETKQGEPHGGHDICYWAGASRALVLAKIEELRQAGVR